VKRPQVLETRVESRSWDGIRPAKVVRQSDRLEPPTSPSPLAGPAQLCSAVDPLTPPGTVVGGTHFGGMRPLVANVAPQVMRTHGSEMGCG
jgi:hypothetical protein